MKFCWVTIKARDMEKSLNFYQKIVGLGINRKLKPDNDTEIVFLGAGETQIELIHNNKEEDVTKGEDISLGFEVDSIEKITEIIKKNNISIYSGPFQPNPAIKFIYILDPNGIKIQFVENL